jgi:hypothetical protein
MKQLFLFLFTVTVTFPLAAQNPGVNLIPEAPDGHFEQGREYITLSADSIHTELGFDGINDEQLVFDFVVINRSDQVIRIDPTEFYYVLLDSATADSSRLPPRMAMHPERILHRYDDRLESGQGVKEMNTIFGFIEAGIDLIASTTAYLTTEDPGFIADAIFSTLETAGYYVLRDELIGEDIDLIREEKEVVSEEIFRLTEIPPGKVVSGFVFFPEYSGSGYLMFCFPVGERMFHFVYRQQRDSLSGN